MSINSKFIIKLLQVVTWMGFIGLCIKAGAILFSYLISMYRNPLAAKDLYLGLDLSQLKAYGNLEYSGLVCLPLTYFNFRSHHVFNIDLDF
jgi:hypothetical protein